MIKFVLFLALISQELEASQSGTESSLASELFSEEEYLVGTWRFNIGFTQRFVFVV